MKKIIKNTLLIASVILGSLTCGCSKDSDINTGYTMLNSSDVDIITSILEKEDTEKIISINLVKNVSSELPYLGVNYSDQSYFYSLTGEQCDIKKDHYDIFISTPIKKNISDTVEILCGNYNGYFISKEKAEYEIGENLANIYYDNFCPINPSYEAIAADKNGQLYLIGDDCIIKISDIEIQLFENVQ